MKKLVIASLLLAPIGVSDALAQEALSVQVGGIRDGGSIADRFAYCAPDGKGATRDGGNISPSISWSGAPGGTQSYALIVVDQDVPASFERANQAGKTIPADFPRQDFYHWVLVDMPASLTSLAEGADGKGITKGGKKTGKTPYGIDGKNDFAKMTKGSNGGYDGPCPPWNDERLHHYHFVIYALDVPSLKLPDGFTGKQAEDAMAGHVLAKGEVVGTYSNNPAVMGK